MCGSLLCCAVQWVNRFGQSTEGIVMYKQTKTQKTSIFFSLWLKLHSAGFAATHQTISTVCLLRARHSHAKHSIHTYYYHQTAGYQHRYTYKRALFLVHNSLCIPYVRSRMRFQLHLVSLVYRQSLYDRHTRQFEPSDTACAVYYFACSLPF